LARKRGSQKGKKAYRVKSRKEIKSQVHQEETGGRRRKKSDETREVGGGAPTKEKNMDAHRKVHQSKKG